MNDAHETAQNDLPDVSTEIATLADMVRNGESCETEEDLRANIDDAIATAKSILANLKAIKKSLTE